MLPWYTSFWLRKSPIIFTYQIPFIKFRYDLRDQSKLSSPKKWKSPVSTIYLVLLLLCYTLLLVFLLLTGKNEAVETERKFHNQSVEIYLFEDKLRRWHSIGHCVDFI